MPYEAESSQPAVPESSRTSRATSSAQAGFLPVPITRLPTGPYDRIAFYLRSRSGPCGDERGGFALYRGERVSFDEVHRQRLIEQDVHFVYIRMADHGRFRRALQDRLEDIAADPALAAAERSAIVYETSVEIVNELLSEPDLAKAAPGLDRTARAVTTLVLSDQDAFSHLFETSHHDFYTATHMVNVATWMVALAYQLGYEDPDELEKICLAGLLHDVGKVFIDGRILNKPGRLTAEEWAEIQRHPELGASMLVEHEGLDPLIVRVAREHHERLDGSGYPDGLRGEQIHPVSLICAVVDSFDAMTAFRPFKVRTMTVAEAMGILDAETPAKYDAQVFSAWSELLGERTEIDPAGIEPVGEQAGADCNDRRRYPRIVTRLGARLHLLDTAGENWCEMPGMQVILHNISRSGVGMLCRRRVVPGDAVHVYVQDRDRDAVRLEGEIVRSIMNGDGWYEVGVHFHKPLADLLWVTRVAASVADRAA